MERSTGYHVWNLGGSRTITLAELLRKIADGIGVEPDIREVPMQPGDVDRTWADGTRARDELDWSATVDIDSGLKLFLEWFVRQNDRAGTTGNRA
jgi:UDP-glucuronate 4-epimerase